MHFALRAGLVSNECLRIIYLSPGGTKSLAGRNVKTRQDGWHYYTVPIRYTRARRTGVIGIRWACEKMRVRRIRRRRPFSPREIHTYCRTSSFQSNILYGVIHNIIFLNSIATVQSYRISRARGQRFCVELCLMRSPYMMNAEQVSLLFYFIFFFRSRRTWLRLKR